MAAKMQCNSYFPACYSQMNLSLDANGSRWPSNCHEKVFESRNNYSGNHYSGFLSSNSLLAYNKELLKQTMLKHETIFKDQIQELHRLYKRQRELMDEISRNNLNKHNLTFEESHSSTPFFQTSSDYDQKSFQVPGFPLINPAGSQVQSLLSSVQGKEFQVCQSCPTTFKACPRDSEVLGSKCKMFGKKLLDLQLSADEYIDSEEKDLLEDEKVSEVHEVSSFSVKRSPQVGYTSDVKSFFGSNIPNSIFLGAVETPSTLEKQKWLADLNEPGEHKEEPASLSNGIIGASSHSRLQCYEPYEKAKLGFQYSLEDSVQNAPRKPGIEVSKNSLVAETGRKQEQLSYHDKAGKLESNLSSFLQGFNAEKPSLFTKSSNKDIERVYETPTFFHGTQNLLTERTIFELESSIRNSAPSKDGHYGLHSSFHDKNFNNRGSWTNSRTGPVEVQALPCESGRNPIAVQALPCLSTSEHLGKRHNPSIGKPEFGGGSKSVCNNHDLNFQSSNDVNLNSKPPSCSSELAVSQNAQTTHGTERHECLVGGPSWLKEMSLHNVLGNNGHGSLNQVEPVSLEAYSVGNHDSDVEPKKVEISDSLSKKLPGFHNYNKYYISGQHCKSSNSFHKTCKNPLQDVKSNGKESVIDLNLACDSAFEAEIELTADGHLGENGINRKHMGYGCLIDLNSSINEAEFTQKSSVVAEIDLDAPASPENKESSPPRGESDENQAETPLLLAGQEDADQQDELAKIAAEAMVSISSFKSPTFKHLEASLQGSLRWFAGIVSSVASDPANEFGLVLTVKDNGNNCEEFLPDGMDYFEAMTLKLTETKPEEFSYKSNTWKEEEMGTSSSPTQVRKGRTRCGGRQRKDFQKEILPTLASLSRYEVTEDLQTIGGLMEAAGTQWEAGSKRYAARNGYLRARKRSTVFGSSGVGCSVESLLKQLSSSNSNVGKEERNVICWGKVTRRRRGQRCPVRVGNQQLILSQV